MKDQGRRVRRSGSFYEVCGRSVENLKRDLAEVELLVKALDGDPEAVTWLKAQPGYQAMRAAMKNPRRV